MPSQLKSDTARSNGAKSRGPKTAAGLGKSSQNALKHGFTSRNMIVLGCEHPDEFEKFVAEYAETYKPVTAAQQNLVDEMIAARWRMQRIWAIETALFDDGMNREAPATENQPDTEDPGIQLAQTFRFLADDSRALSLVSRYESRFHRIYHRAYQTLRELQAGAPKLQATEPAQPQPEAPPPPAAVKTAEPRPAENVENTNSAFPLRALRLCAKIKVTPRPALRLPTRKVRNEPSNSRTLRRLRNGNIIHLLKGKRYGQAKIA
jgi:hypothetical protein